MATVLPTAIAPYEEKEAMVKIYIHFKFVKTGWGGSNSFLSTLARYLERQPGVTLVTSIQDECDIFLMSSWSTGEKPTSVRTIDNIRRYGVPNAFSRWWKRRTHAPIIVHRLDGIGYLYGRPDRSADERQADLNQLSDHTVVQSRYSQTLFTREGFSLSPTTVIPNGVDTTLFNMKGRVPWDGRRPLVLGAASWSANPRKGHQALAAFSQLPEVRVIFTGNWPQEIPPANVERRPPTAAAQLPDFYRSCDAFLFPAQDEACPNALLEAIACGLPCLYHPSGGTPEVANAYGVPLDTADLRGSLETLKTSYPSLLQKIQEGAEKQFSIDHVGRRYLDLFQTLL